MTSAADTSALGAAFTAAGAIVGGFFTWRAARRKGRTDDQATQNAMIKIAQEAVTETVAALRNEVRALRDDAEKDRARIAGLEKDLATEKRLRRKERHELADRATKAVAEALLATRRAEKAERQSENLAGECRQLQQQVDSHVRRLRDLGVDVPEPGQRTTEPVLMGEPIPAPAVAPVSGA